MPGKITLVPSINERTDEIKFYNCRVGEYWDLFLNQIYQTTWLEFIAVVFGLLTVWYSKQENILVYPTGIVNVLIYVWITFQYRLYADAGINAYYFFMSVYGWYHWTDMKSSTHQIPITTNNTKEHLIAIGITIGSFSLIRFGLDFTDSDVPNWDALSTSFPIAAMWLMARKKLQHWIYWIITDLIAVPLYFYKGLPLTSLQYLVWTIIAIWGWFSWRRTYLANTQKV